MVVRAANRALAIARRAAPAQLAGYLSAQVLGGLTPLAVAWLTKAVVDRLAAGTVSWSDIVGLAATLAAIGVAAALAPHAIRYLRLEMERRVRLDCTGRLYAAVDQFIGLRRFEDPAFLDHVQTAQSAGINGPGEVVDSGFGMLRSLITVLGFAGTLLLLGPWMAVVVLASAVPAMVAEIAVSRRRAAMVARIGPAQRRELFFSSLLTNPDAAKEVRLFGVGRYLWRRMTTEIDTINREHRRIDRRELAVQAVLALLSAGVTGALLLFTVRSAVRGELSVGDVVLVVAAVASVQAALAGLVTDTVSAYQALLLFRHYLTVVDAGPDLPVPAHPRPVPPLLQGIELRDVWFRYADDQPWVLRGVNLLIPAGSTTAVVGLNGAGKSTLVKLLCRLYDPTRGAVLWDGVDLREFDPVRLRERIRTVFQDALAYDLTARENIALGDLTALTDQARIEAAARTAGIHDVLAKLPRGYETLLTRIFFAESEHGDAETGVVLSGGQQQRLAIARGLILGRSDLLILDEPSSALDAEAEHDVHARLRDARRGRTGLLISHRLGVVREADSIVVLAEGEITERGSHDELIAAEGAYAALFELQAAGYRAPTVEAAA
ncbi:ABC transporter ATP-binding protein/permease [Micromonospora sp. A3M-1-15]|uniref:ABC transporter ATP-binding protein n=1 Tax=Micromonospora sp. A3M-1-15 TaxID=2962035 RepID=UPI0020B8A734|nr:ABC transporter ATP-binding protein [Micromonospora sp. A3M-1-15]MCP3784062.1 ABC transporter ATP-binding protein/permease [Micromonospora sp. A3M-1-15]